MIDLQDIGRTHARKGAVPVTALEGLSLRVEPGDFTAIVGPSGSGKSTLLNIMGLLDRPTAGSYRLDGREVGGLGVDETARIRNETFGFVFQAFHLLPRTTALENVGLPLVYSDKERPTDAAREALEVVGLAHRAGHYPSELSGGEQQRVAIARALVNAPRVILADEPTGNLDPQAAAEIMSIFERLHAAGTTVVLITHDQAVADRAPRRVRLAAGRLVADSARNPERALTAREA